MHPGAGEARSEGGALIGCDGLLRTEHLAEQAGAGQERVEALAKIPVVAAKAAAAQCADADVHQTVRRGEGPRVAGQQVALERDDQLGNPRVAGTRVRPNRHAGGIGARVLVEFPQYARRATRRQQRQGRAKLDARPAVGAPAADSNDLLAVHQGTVDDQVLEARARLERGLEKNVIEDATRQHPERVLKTNLRAPGRDRQQSSRTKCGLGDSPIQSEQLQCADGIGNQTITAGLVAREFAAITENHPFARAGESNRGRGPGRTGTSDHDINGHDLWSPRCGAFSVPRRHAEPTAPERVRVHEVGHYPIEHGAVRHAEGTVDKLVKYFTL